MYFRLDSTQKDEDFSYSEGGKAFYAKDADNAKITTLWCDDACSNRRCEYVRIQSWNGPGSGSHWLARFQQSASQFLQITFFSLMA